MQSTILASKPMITKNGEIIVDLTSKSINYVEEPVVIDAVIVSDNMTMRADLLAKNVYGDDADWDILLKFNGISNPFSLDEDQLLFVPDLSWMYSNLVNETSYNESEQVRSKYLDKSKKSEVDKNKIQYSQLIKQLKDNISSNANYSTYNLPPNFSEPGDKEAKIDDNGNIIFGDYVTK